MEAISEKIIQNVFLGPCVQRNRLLGTHHASSCAFNTHYFLPLHGRKLAWAGMSPMHLQTLAKHENDHGNRASVFCRATADINPSPSFEKIDFLKLQNGSDIRGVAVAGVEGEPVSLTEPVTEAIAAAFAGWLLDKKKPDGLRCLSISIGHDSRISARILQPFFAPVLLHVLLAAVKEIKRYKLERAKYSAWIDQHKMVS